MTKPKALFPLMDVKLTLIGKMLLATASWGHFVDTQTFKQQFPQVDSEWLEGTGFIGGRKYPSTYDVHQPNFVDDHADKVVRLLQPVLDIKGWQDIDCLVIATTTIPGFELATHVQDQLEIRLQVTVKKTKVYTLACDGFIGATTDMARMPEFQHKRVVVVAIEAISGNQMNPHDPETNFLFGNGMAILAFQPGRDIEILFGKAIIDYDESNVFRIVPRNQGLSWKVEALPTWYEVHDNAHEKLFASEQGILLDILHTTPDLPYLFMDATGNYKYFARMIPDMLIWAADEYQREWLPRFGPMGTAWAHQPSLPVVTGVLRRTNKLLKARQLAPLEIPWLMTEPPFSCNTSGATAGFALERMIRGNLITLNQPLAYVGFGVGFAFHVGVMVFKKTYWP